MAQPRAQWKGYLKLGMVSCPVALYTAASEAERVSFHTLNRATGHRVRRQFVDAETGDPVEAEDQVKGYPVADDEYVLLEDEEIKAAIPESSKTIEIDQFVREGEADLVFVDRPYFLAPAGKAAEEAFAVIRAAMAAKKVLGLGHTVLFRRERFLLLSPLDGGMLAHTLRFDYEIRRADTVFDDIPEMKLSKEMLDLARHIIETKAGRFDPKAFDDRYEAALVEVVKAKQAGRKIPARASRPRGDNVVDLLDALRRSAGAAPKGKAPKRRTAAKGQKAAKKTAAGRSRLRKAG